ncbi:MAG TPA: hypothetical protein VK563_05585 [Puia sp.]|nr:hypothetical protein [Puia sp.]
MLQNRVDPVGDIIKTKERGLWMGNRGIVSNDRQEVTRAFGLMAWITCRLEYKGKRLPLMEPNHNTQLFFMDEATSFSAGHRPCAFCRREDFNRFKEYWLKGNPGSGFDKKTSIREIDAVLQKERIGADRSKVTHDERPDQLPDGAFVLFNDEPCLLYGGQLYRWSPSGYGMPVALPGTGMLPVLTPRSVINAFKAGYKPQMTLSDALKEATPSFVHGHR